MEYLEAEGDYNPVVGPRADAEPHCAWEGLGTLSGEVQAAIMATLGELAALASTLTADTTHAPASPAPSAYSLLIEPALLRLPV